MSQNSFNVDPTRPIDLTQYLDKATAQHCGGGAYADVHRCQCRLDGISKEVAVKALRFRFAIDENESKKMFLRETGIWRRLKHPNIVPFLGIAYGFGIPDSMSLVSSWMPNGTLYDFLGKQDHNLVLEHRLRLLLDIANGLSYIHSFDVVHGDLSSNNVLVDEDYNACLVDFGHASLVENIPEGLTYLQTSTIRPGTLRWAAPERVKSEGVQSRSTRSDIYSFGCIGLQVLSGKVPWSEIREDMAIVQHILVGDNPGRPVSRAIEDVHWDLIQHCWSPIDERPSAGEVMNTIYRLLHRFQPLRELLASQSSRADFLPPVVESFPSLRHITMENPRVVGELDAEDRNRTVAHTSSHTRRVFIGSPQDLYANNLQQPFGYPLRCPEPSSDLPISYQANGLHIGDVGYIDDEGVFHVMMNVYFGPDYELHQRNRVGLDDLVDHTQLDYEGFLHIENALPQGRVIGHGIRQAAGGHRFVSDATSGAILVLPYGATRERLSDRKDENLRKLAEKYGLKWCRIAGRRTLCLITGFYKTHSWHLASFHDVEPGQVIGGRDATGKYVWDSICDFREASSEIGPMNQTVLISAYKIDVGRWDNVVITKLVSRETSSNWSLLTSLPALLYKSISIFSWSLQPSDSDVMVNRVPA